ncbi:MAG: hypothetical protein ACRC6A_00100 [Fusobacteriaceae bacterium]
MAGVKGQKSGGFGGRKQLPELEKKKLELCLGLPQKKKRYCSS